MTIRRRLVLSFGATLLLFCLNLLAHFVTSRQRDVSLQHFEAAVQRRLLWASLEHEYRNRWQELSVLSELPFTAAQAKEVQDRIAQLSARVGPVAVADEAMTAAPLARFVQAQRAFQERSREWFDRRLAGGGAAGGADGFDAVSTALANTLEQLDALNAGDERLVNDEMAHLAQLTRVMNRISVATFMLSMFVAAAIAILFSRYLTRVLRRLQSGAERVGRGDLTARIDHRSDDELGSLARSFDDMTAKLAKTMTELVDARAEADRASQAKSAFLAKMSHEFRTPMLAVQGYAELIQQEAEQRGLLEIGDDSKQIQVAGQHLVQLLNEVLDLSKIESGKMTLVIDDLNLRRIVDEVAATVKPLVAQRSNTLTIEVDEALAPSRGDEIKLRQVLLNLLGNASKFTSNGTITLRVMQQDRDNVIFEVSDSGIGMTAEQTTRIFEEFEQAEPTTARAFGGSGLGLAICQKLSTLMGGDISVASELGQGTTFRVTLPLSAAAAPYPAASPSPDAAPHLSSPVLPAAS
jgi:signal transduction histidine kinase